MMLKSDELSKLDKLFCICLIVSSGSLFHGENTLFAYLTLGVYLILLLSGKIVALKKPQVVVYILLTFAFFTVQNLYYYGNTNLELLVKNCLIMYAVITYGISKYFYANQILNYIVKVILCLSFVSNVLYVMYTVGVPLPLRPFGDSSIEHFWYLMSVARSDLNFDLYRNGGIYWEPGMYQVYLNFALLWLLSGKERFNIKLIIYLILTILTTMSVSGYVVTVGILATYALFNNNSRTTKTLILFAGIVAFILILPPLISSLTAKQDTMSYELRNIDLTLGFSMFLDKPILGYGIVNDTYMQYSEKLVGLGRGMSNGMIALLVNTGLLGVMVVAKFLIQYIRYGMFSQSKFYAIGFVLWYIISINTEPIVFHDIPLLFLSIGMGYSLAKQTALK